MVEVYLEYRFSPGLEGLLLATQLIPLGQPLYSLSTQILKNIVHEVTKLTEMWVGSRTQCKHREPIN